MRRGLNRGVVKMNKKHQSEFNRKNTDPLLALAGTLKYDVTDKKKYYKTSGCPKIRVVKGPYKDHSDPLIALLGTLECDVTDISERHDDYIGDAILAELWEDEQE